MRKFSIQWNFRNEVSKIVEKRWMGNFPYINCWVNTACPRIGQDDIVRHKFPVVNLKDVFKK